MTMKRMVCVFAAVAAMMATEAVASTAVNSAKARVPFEFVVNGVALPAGQYTFTAPNAAGMVLILDENQRTVAQVFGTRVYEAGRTAPQLVFVKKDGKNFLSQVLTQSSQGGAEFHLK